jgi:hypothetical protein
MSKYTVNMSDQLNKIRTAAHEKLKKESEVVVEVQKPSSLQTAAVDYLSRKEEPHPLSSPKNINESVTEGKMNDLHMYIKQGKTAKEIGKLMGVDPKTIQKLMDAYDAKNESVELDENVNSDIKKILDKEKISYKIHTSKHSLGQKGIITGVFVKAKDERQARIALGKVSPYPHTITVHAEGVDLDEREKSVRQLINPTKAVMIVKKNKVIVIDKKDQDKYMKQGWTLAEEVALEEARWKVKIEGLPPIYMDSKSAGEVRSQLRKLIKKPDMIQDIERVTDAEVKKAFRDKASGKEVEESKLDETGHTDVASAMNNVKVAMSALTKMSGELSKLSPEDALPSWWTNKVAIAVDKLDGMADYLDTQVEEAKLINKPTGEVLKTGSKEKMETERKRNRDELQVKEWFKAKNIDVKVRELDESTQVYVPLGRRIPNEIREELITTQYGKMPEDVKNVKDINYGNFMENSITMNNDFWSKVLHGTKGE